MITIIEGPRGSGKTKLAQNIIGDRAYMLISTDDDAEKPISDLFSDIKDDGPQPLFILIEEIGSARLMHNVIANFRMEKENHPTARLVFTCERRMSENSTGDDILNIKLDQFLAPLTKEQRDYFTLKSSMDKMNRALNDRRKAGKLKNCLVVRKDCDSIVEHLFFDQLDLLTEE